jgi:predicted transposase YdaD
MEIPKELLDNEHTREAVGYMERAAYTKEQLATYDKWKIAAMTERSAINDALQKGEAIGREKGEAIGREKGEAIGREKGEQKKAITVALKALEMGMSIEDASRLSDLSKQQIEELIRSDKPVVW